MGLHATRRPTNAQDVPSPAGATHQGFAGMVTATAVGLILAFAYYLTPAEADQLSDPHLDPIERESLAKAVVARSAEHEAGG